MKRQLELTLDNGKWGGRRKGAGKKRIHSAGVAHTKREKITSREPLHVNFKLTVTIKNENGLRAIKKSLENARKYFHILHYSLQWNHIHLIIEATDNEALFRGMRSFTNTFVKCMGKGSIQKERYHLHVLRSVKETKNAFRYVIFNEAHHSRKKVVTADAYSSLHQLNLKELAKQFKFSIVKKSSHREISLDQPTSWLAKNGLKPT